MTLGKMSFRPDGTMEVEEIEVQPDELEGLQNVLNAAEKVARAARMPVVVAARQEKCQVVDCTEPAIEPVNIASVLKNEQGGYDSVRIHVCKKHAEQAKPYS